MSSVGSVSANCDWKNAKIVLSPSLIEVIKTTGVVCQKGNATQTVLRKEVRLDIILNDLRRRNCFKMRWGRTTTLRNTTITTGSLVLVLVKALVIVS